MGREERYHVRKLADIFRPEVTLMKVIGNIPLGEPDRALLGVNLPDSLEKSRQSRDKLYGLGGGRLV